jgi:ABC-type nitrate/sulfonate/bicarbonate transport system substrate-binding protein
MAVNAKRIRLRSTSALLAVVLAALLSYAAGASASSTTTTAKQDVGVRFAFDSFINGTLPLVSDSQGYFANNGVHPSYRTFSVGVQALDAVLSGQADMAIALDFAALTRFRSNQLRLVAVQSVTLPGFYQLAARSGISTAADLIGKKMGVLIGTNQQYLTVRWLRLHRIDPRKVKFVPVPSPFELVAGLQTGNIDAGWVFGAALAAVGHLSDVKLIATDEGGKLNERVWVVASKSFLSHNPGAAVGVLKAFTAAAAWTNQNPHDAAQILSGLNHAPVTVLEPAITKTHWVNRINRGDIASLANVIRFARASGFIQGSIELKNFVVTTYLRKANPGAVQVLLP